MINVSKSSSLAPQSAAVALGREEMRRNPGWRGRLSRRHRSFLYILLLLIAPAPSLAQPASLRCVANATNPKKVIIVVVDSERGEIRTENISGDNPRRRLVFHIEEARDSIIEARKLGRREDFFLEINRMTGHVVESVDDQEPTQYDCEAP